MALGKSFLLSNFHPASNWAWLFSLLFSGLCYIRILKRRKGEGGEGVARQEGKAEEQCGVEEPS